MSLLETVEHAVKGPVWDCRMCGQCVLHDTGLTCPMTCPKTLRNGPCGGVRPDGNRLKGTSSWRNLLSGRDKETPAGWAAGDVAP
jgi:hypothetical protein